MRIVVFVVALVLAMSLGGCLDAEEDKTDLQTDGEAREGHDGQEKEEDEENEESVDETGIRGEVVDVSFAPIAGADVELLLEGELLDDTKTEDGGSFAFMDLDPGEYRLRISASCCKQLVKSAIVRPGEVTEVTVELEEHKPVEGYVVEYTWEGFIACSGYLPVYGVLLHTHGFCANVDPNNDPTHEFQVEPGLKTVVMGMVWEEEVTNPMGDLQIYMVRGSGTDEANRWFTIWGPSPLEIVVGPDEADGGEHLHFDNIEDTWDVAFRVLTSTEQASIVYQQPFTVYYDLYYNEPAPEGASAIPE